MIYQSTIKHNNKYTDADTDTDNKIQSDCANSCIRWIAVARQAPGVRLSLESQAIAVEPAGPVISLLSIARSSLHTRVDAVECRRLWVP